MDVSWLVCCNTRATGLREWAFASESPPAETSNMLRAIPLFLLFAFSCADAAVTTVASYRLGEADPGAVAGAPGADPTLASTGSVNLGRNGAPFYSGQIPPFVTSALSMRFNGGPDRYTGALVSNATNNFGVEAWVKSDGSTAQNAALVYNGNTGSSGWGLFRFGGEYGYLYGGVVIRGAAPVTTAWTHLALVRDGGTTRFFVNGQQRFSSGDAPNVPAGAFMVGGNPLVATEGFDGLVDEVRVFTFAPGQFVVTDLNLGNPPPPMLVPVDSTPLGLVLALLVLLIGVTVLRRPGS